MEQLKQQKLELRLQIREGKITVAEYWGELIRINSLIEQLKKVA